MTNCRSYKAEQTRAITERVDKTCEGVGSELRRQIQVRTVFVFSADRQTGCDMRSQALQILPQVLLLLLLLKKGARRVAAEIGQCFHIPAKQSDAYRRCCMSQSALFSLLHAVDLNRKIQNTGMITPERFSKILAGCGMVLHFMTTMPRANTSKRLLRKTGTKNPDVTNAYYI